MQRLDLPISSRFKNVIKTRHSGNPYQKTLKMRETSKEKGKRDIKVIEKRNFKFNDIKKGGKNACDVFRNSANIKKYA